MPRKLVREVLDRCWSVKRMGRQFTDFDPLVVVMFFVTGDFYPLSFKDPKVRRAWRVVLIALQANNSILEHNQFIPCRQCNQAFEPVIDDTLLTMFLAWYDTQYLSKLLEIHRCPSCGGKLAAKGTMTYKGDMHTPPPGSVADDREWARLLLQYHEI